MKNSLNGRYHTRVVVNIIYSTVVACMVMVFLVTNLSMIGQYAAERGMENSLVLLFYRPGTMIVLLYVLLGIGVFSVSFLLLQSRSMRYISRISSAMREIAEGDLNITLDVEGDDEFADMAENLNNMVEELRQLMDKERESERTKNELITNVAHDLRTPLTSIIGYADMLRSTPMTEEETMEAANYIFQQGKRLESLSFKLLELIVTDKQQYQFRMISVERLVNEALRLTREKREERKIALHLGLEEGEIFGERDLLLSVLVNLLDNSRKAVRTGGRIQILGRNYGKTYELCISDNGCGMDAGESQRVTEAFYMIDKSRARREGGAGLGMTLCSRILALHHVRWKIFSKPGKGTVIVIRFHCEREATDDE